MPEQGFAYKQFFACYCVFAMKLCWYYPAGFAGRGLQRRMNVVLGNILLLYNSR